MLADQSKYLSDRQITQNSVEMPGFGHKIYDFYRLLALCILCYAETSKSRTQGPAL